MARSSHKTGRHPTTRAHLARALAALLACALVLVGAGPAQAAESYVVQEGDTLARIALLSTGDSSRFQELLDANADLLARAGQLEVGMRLVLPPGWRAPDPSRLRPAARDATPDGDADGVIGETVLTPREPPAANLWDRLAFFPHLRELDDDFEILMLRAAYEGDVAWGEARVQTKRETSRELLEQQILQAETERDKAKAEFEACKEAVTRAEILLQKFRKESDSEFEGRRKDILDRLEDAVQDEQQVWEGRLFPYLTEPGRDAWRDFTAALTTSAFTDAQTRHLELDPWRLGIDSSVIASFTPEELDAFRGERTDAVLAELYDLRSDKAYVAEVHERQRYRDALEAIQNRGACERTFYDAEDFLREKRRKLVSLQIGVGYGTGDALTVDAGRVAARYAAALAEVQLVDAWLSNDLWASLWWKAGVAARLSGDHDLGARRIAQAAAVARGHRLPQEEIPRSLDGWLRSAENEVLRSRPGSVHVLVPPTAVLTVDGETVETTFGEAELELAPGIHRFVFWIGRSEPIMRLVGVASEGEHSFTWYLPRDLTGDDEELMGQRPVLPVLPDDPKPRRWHYGVTARAGMLLGRPVVGADVTVRYLPRFIGGELGLSLLAPFDAFWLRPGEELYLVTRVHGGVALRGRFQRFSLVGVVGGFVDPLLSAGPQARLDVGYDLREDERLRVALDVFGGYDLLEHATQIPRWHVGGGLALWF